MKRSMFVTMFGLLGAMAAAFQPVAASAAEPHHFKAASFQVTSEGAKPTYAPTFNGDVIKLIQSVEGTSEPFVLVHTPHIHPGDIVNLQADVLGAGDGNNLEDDGMNCQLSYNTSNDVDYTIGGMCSFFVSDHATGESEKRNVIVVPQSIKVSDEANGYWVLLFNDEQAGIAFYAGIER